MAAHSLGGAHFSAKNHDLRSHELCEYMEGSVWMAAKCAFSHRFWSGLVHSAYLPAVGQKLGRRSLYSAVPNPFRWSADGTVGFTVEAAARTGLRPRHPFHCCVPEF